MVPSLNIFFLDMSPFFSCCFWMCLRNHHQAETTSGVVQWLACWAHNPKVPGLKPGSAMVWHDICFHASSVLLQCRITKGCSGNWTQDLSTWARVMHATRPNSQLPRLCVRTVWTVTSNFSLSALVPAQEGPEKDLQPEWVCLQAGALPL